MPRFSDAWRRGEWRRHFRDPNYPAPDKALFWSRLKHAIRIYLSSGQTPWSQCWDVGNRAALRREQVREYAKYVSSSVPSPAPTPRPTWKGEAYEWREMYYKERGMLTYELRRSAHIAAQARYWKNGWRAEALEAEGYQRAFLRYWDSAKRWKRIAHGLLNRLDAARDRIKAQAAAFETMCKGAEEMENENRRLQGFIESQGRAIKDMATKGDALEKERDDLKRIVDEQAGAIVRLRTENGEARLAHNALIDERRTVTTRISGLLELADDLMAANESLKAQLDGELQRAHDVAEVAQEAARRSQEVAQQMTEKAHEHREEASQWMEKHVQEARKVWELQQERDALEKALGHWKFVADSWMKAYADAGDRIQELTKEHNKTLAAYDYHKDFTMRLDRSFKHVCGQARRWKILYHESLIDKEQRRRRLYEIIAAISGMGDRQHALALLLDDAISAPYWQQCYDTAVDEIARVLDRESYWKERAFHVAKENGERYEATRGWINTADRWETKFQHASDEARNWKRKYLEERRLRHAQASQSPLMLIRRADEANLQRRVYRGHVNYLRKLLQQNHAELIVANKELEWARGRGCYNLERATMWQHKFERCRVQARAWKKQSFDGLEAACEGYKVIHDLLEERDGYRVSLTRSDDELRDTALMYGCALREIGKLQAKLGALEDQLSDYSAACFAMGEEMSRKDHVINCLHREAREWKQFFIEWRNASNLNYKAAYSWMRGYETAEWGRKMGEREYSELWEKYITEMEIRLQREVRLLRLEGQARQWKHRFLDMRALAATRYRRLHKAQEFAAELIQEIHLLVFPWEREEVDA